MTKLPPGWEWARLGDLGVEVRGQVRPEPDVTYDLYSVPAFPSQHPERVDGASIKSGKRSVLEGDVLLCKINPRINRVWVVAKEDGFPQIASTEYLVLRLYEPQMASAIRWYLSSPRFRDWIKLSVEGATGSHTRAKSGPVLDQSVPLPPQAEQKRIVAAIEEHCSRLDAVERAIDAALIKLEAFRLSSFDQLFDKPNWTWTTLGQIAEVKGGVTKDSKNQGNPAYIEVPYLRVANVQRGYLDLEEITTIRVKPEKAARLWLQPGDILFNEGGDRDKLGRGWVWEGQIEDCIHQNHVFRARLTSEAFDPYFVSMHGNSWGQRWFETHGKQTTNLASLNLATLKSFPVPAPSLAEQQEVVTHLQEIMDLESRLRGELDQARRNSESLRRSILSHAFSGRLVPQDPADEPAAALLERISGPHPSKGN